MKNFRLEQFVKGWIVGDFEPNIIRTKNFEIAVKKYFKGDAEASHIHKKADEITVVVTGMFIMNDKILKEGDIIWLKPGESANFLCLQDGFTTVIKSPSVIGDKFFT